MIRKPNGSDAKRLGTGVLVAGVVAAGAVALAGPASAAATAITATPAQSNYAAGSTATINVTTTGTPTSLMYRITAGPDKTAGTTGIACAPPAASPSVCTFTNNGTAGTDTVQVFDDADGSGTFNTGETQTTTTVVFSGNPTALTLSPSNGGSVSVGNPATFTVHATDVNGNASAGATVAISSVETNATATSTLTYSDSTGTGRGATVDAPVTGSTTNFTHTATENVTTDASGNATVKVASDTAGSVAVTASYNTVKSAASTFTVTGGKTMNNNVTKITATPATQTAGTKGAASVVVKATDSNGDPVGGVTVSYEITSGPDATATGTYSTCAGMTDQASGNVTCAIQNGNAAGAGTDAIEFFVNQTVPGTTQTAGPDSTEPTATASVSFVAQPAYDSITLTTPDQTKVDNTDATVITGTASSTFTATVEEENAAGTAEVPVSGAVVNFSTSAVAPNGTTVALNPTSATTDASGVATTVATPSTTTTGTTYTVTAIVGNGSSYNGGGMDSASATVTYAASAAQAPVLTPTTQSATIGGSATVTATVDDQFGTPKANVSVAFTVTGRNNGQAQNITTNASGKAVFTYTDAPTTNSTTDTVTATTAAGNDMATVYWISGSTTANTATLALQGDNLGPNCNGVNTAGTAETCDIESASNQEYADDAVVTVDNSAGQALAGVSVTFTASQAFIGDGTNSAADFKAGSTSYTTTTDANGQAVVDAGSTKSGDQAITATVGTVKSNAVTITYVATPQFEDTATFTLTPATAQVSAGGSQKFTATALDEFGNGLSNDEILFSQNGPGTVNNTFGFTGPDGTASVLLSVPAGATGTGTVTATDDGVFGNGGDTAVSNYTVTSTPGKIAVQLSGGAKNGSAATATATVTDANGTPVNGAVVNFAVSGAETTSGMATTNGNGVATFNFTTTHSGSFTVTATSGTATPGTATGNTAKTTVTASVALASTVKHQVMETATISLKRAGVTVRFYSVTDGVDTFVASATTNSNGVARHTVTKLTSNHNYRVVARAVNLPGDYTGTYSPKATIKVS